MAEVTPSKHPMPSLDEMVKNKNVEDLPWFQKDLGNLKPDARELFEKYSKIPTGDVISHVVELRDKAFKVFPYPCLGQWGFLNLSIRQSSKYNDILERVKAGDKYLDLGCCVGQDIRTLVYDGAPSENTYGSDLEKEFMEVGYDLFLDKQTLKTDFITADVLDPNSELKQLDGIIDIIHIASVLHLFDWDEQLEIAKRIIALLKAKSGSLVVGRQTGNLTAGVMPPKSDTDKRRFLHNADSFVKLWDQAGEETGTKWETEASLANEDVNSKWDAKVQAMLPPGMRHLSFSVRRI
ncbi:hypothetical protein B0J11DRAFT_521451 [Dendryphion nanum]|uniref:Methyltransferase domain-containing protein n=1 Tax=Dendryphion nanum TaxID=256645 RepID=A0A9P9E831_9PLEO|nr:hypothetical protein B0J11DRAFT_521451 [Dendryphion nanum]